MRAHSIHAYFIRPGNINHPVLYHVGSFETAQSSCLTWIPIYLERIRDGRSFAARNIRGMQDGKIIFQMLVIHTLNTF